MSLALLFQQNLASATTVNLAGSATAIATASGALAQAISLAGSALAQATATGNLVKAGSLAGNATAIASATGALTLAISLAGSALAQSTATGTLANGAAAINLAGSAAAVASAVATLSAGTALAGAASALATASGALAQALTLGGSAQAATTASGALSVIAAFSSTPNASRTLAVSENMSFGPAYRLQPDGIPIILHSPVALLDYTMDWQARGWLEQGEYITGQTITTDAGISTGSVNLSPLQNSAAVQIWLAGGTAGSTYLVTCQITTSLGRIDERSFRVMVMLR